MEQWKQVSGYENYEVSDNGRVRRNERLLKPIVSKSGYASVHLSKNGLKKKYRINRLVAIAFLENPYGYPVVNHKDENKLNNNVNNLEWCDHTYNANYGTRNERISKRIKNLDTGEVFKSTCEAAKSVNRPPTSISRCCKGKRRSCGSYRWAYI